MWVLYYIKYSKFKKKVLQTLEHIKLAFAFSLHIVYLVHKSKGREIYIQINFKKIYIYILQQLFYVYDQSIGGLGGRRVLGNSSMTLEDSILWSWLDSHCDLILEYLNCCHLICHKISNVNQVFLLSCWPQSFFFPDTARIVAGP